jgi:hypothetical protein
MKTLRQLCVALTFTLVLAITTFAGEIHTTVAPPTPPSSQGAIAAGEISTTVTGQEGTDSSEATATDSTTKIALNLLQSVLSLF